MLQAVDPEDVRRLLPWGLQHGKLRLKGILVTRIRRVVGGEVWRILGKFQREHFDNQKHAVARYRRASGLV